MHTFPRYDRDIFDVKLVDEEGVPSKSGKILRVVQVRTSDTDVVIMDA